jgi:hypothetical protein
VERVSGRENEEKTVLFLRLKLWMTKSLKDLAQPGRLLVPVQSPPQVTVRRRKDVAM